MKSTKYKNVLKNNKVALVINDLRSIDPRVSVPIAVFRKGSPLYYKLKL